MKLIVGNWKMHLGVRESVALARGVLRALRGKDVTPDVVICPAFTSLSEVHKVLARSRVKLGAQNCGPEKSGAITGEVSISMLEDVHASYVIIGHSERRQVFGEDDALIAKKLQLAYESSVQPILCVGEEKSVREAGEAEEAESFVISQVTKALAGISVKRKQNVVVAYEPVWAIGTGETPDVGDVVSMHQLIRETVQAQLNVSEDQVLVLYGGSVNEENAYRFLREGEIDGLLIGGASRKLASFSTILDAASEVISAQS